jgi:hypothetical protein
MPARADRSDPCHLAGLQLPTAPDSPVMGGQPVRTIGRSWLAVFGMPVIVYRPAAPVRRCWALSSWREEEARPA